MLELGIWPPATASQRAWKFEPLPLAITKIRHASAMAGVARGFSGVAKREELT